MRVCECRASNVLILKFEILISEFAHEYKCSRRSMLHPAPLDSVGTMISVKHIRCTYKGQTAHAGATPWEGINAQDAGVLAVRY